MKICYLAPANSVHTMKWARHFVERGDKVSLISFEYPVWDIPGLEFIKMKRLLNSRLDFALNINKVKDILRDISPDILHAHYATDYGFLAAMAGFHPFIVSVWGSDIYITPRRSIFHRKLVKFNLSRADVICSTSRAMAEETKKYIFDKNNIYVTPFGIDLDEFKPVPGQKNINEIILGTIKTLVKGKGLGTDILISVFSDLQKKFRNLKLRIVGDGDHRRELEELAKALGVSDKVEFLGKIPHSDVPRFLSGVDIYCHLSRSESFGVAPLEASACEIPIVISNVGGLPEIIENNITGFLVNPSETGSIRDAITGLIESEELRRKMGEAGRRFVAEKYDWRNNAKIMERIYSKVLKV